MPNEILTIAESYAADRFAEENGVPSATLMENAGRSVAEEIGRRWPAGTACVLCGPGNNGGDGFAAARHLKHRGWAVRAALLDARERLKGDAALMADRWDGAVEPLSSRALQNADVVVDALFGAGLARPLEGQARGVVEALDTCPGKIIAVDVPSGLHGDLARPPEGPDGVAARARLTITFFRKKPAHVLAPGRFLCGEVVVTDIGIPDAALAGIGPRIFENGPALWIDRFPWPQAVAHKYARGHTVVVSGPEHATGAARLAARGALRVGAGLVSVASPLTAVSVNAALLTAIMVKPFAGVEGLEELLEDRRLNAIAVGPGCGVGRETRELVTAALASKAAIVLDADALTSFTDGPNALFVQLREPAVLTPHEGEFERIFPTLLKRSPTRVEAAREAAAAARCTILLKGPDTVIASPDGRVIVNSNAPPTLATAGAGDVLSGMVAGLMAQGMESFGAAATAVWLHGEAASQFGPGLISEDIPEILPCVLGRLREQGP
jgi:hydroxyethylthiazole kinase-like uncharacterized protein yjeF